MVANHPDAGGDRPIIFVFVLLNQFSFVSKKKGSPLIATKVNQAKELLLKDMEGSSSASDKM
jgi:hypothetical protein